MLRNFICTYIFCMRWPTLVCVRWSNLETYKSTVRHFNISVDWSWSRKAQTKIFNIKWRYLKPTGCPKKMWFKPIFEFMTLEWVFLGVKNNSKNFGNKKNSRLLSKIWSKWALFVWKMRKILWFYQFMTMFRMENSF